MEILQDFGVDLKLLVAQVINFLVLLFLLRLLLYKPILKMLEERKARIKESMEQASMIEERLAKLEAEQSSMMKKAQADADKLIKEATDNSKAMAAETVTLAREQADRVLAKAQEQAKTEFEQMRVQLRKEVAALAVSVSEKVLEDVLTAEQKKRLTEKAAKELLS